MAYSLNKGYTDSITTPKTVSVPDLKYTTDFKVSTDVPGELIMTNVTSPLDRNETIRFAVSNVKDIYAGSGVDSSCMAASHQGISLVAQVADVWRYADSAVPTAPVVDLPISAHLVIKAPKSSYLSADDYLAIAQRAFALLFATGSVTSTRLMQMLKGALDPNA
jgi:hypothetical protein